MNILITGVAGFIGSSLAEELLNTTDNIIIGLDNMYNGSEERLSILSSFKNFRFYPADIRDYEAIQNIIYENSIDGIYHLAGIVSVQESIRNPLFTGMINVQGTLNILEAARQNHVKRIVFSSSAAVYGNDLTLPKDETSPTNPISPYGCEKLLGEHYMKLYTELYKLETVSLRYFNVYGKGQNSSSDYSGVISKFKANFLQNQTSNIYGDGNQYRDFISIKDVVLANILAMNTANIGGEILCLGTSQATTINTVFTMLNQKHNQTFSPHYLPKPAGDIDASVCNNTKVKQMLGIKYFIPFEEGIMQL